MFNIAFPTRSASKASKDKNFFRPFVEELEARWCPAATNTINSAIIQASHYVQVSGRLTNDDNLTDYHIFGSGVPANLYADSAGYYSYSTNEVSLGQIYTQAMNSQPVSTNTSYYTVFKSAPALTLSLSYGSGTTVTLSGALDDIDKSGRTVTFSGVASGTATTNSSGNFSLTTTASEVGDIHANETDLWGQASNTATVTVTTNAPVIINFEAVLGSGSTWIFRGRVIDEQAEGLTVRLGGISCLIGVTVTTDADGYFSIARDINPGDLSGTASAIVTDWWGIDSEIVYDVLT